MSESRRECNRSLSLDRFKLVECAGPVGSEETREAAVGEDSAAGLAGGAVVGLVVGVADALDRRGAAWAWEIEAAVNGHIRTEGGDLLGETLLGFLVEAIDPGPERVSRGFVELLHLRVGELARLREWGELCGVEDLVGVSVADSGEDAGIGEGALEGVIFCGESLAGRLRS